MIIVELIMGKVDVTGVVGKRWSMYMRDLKVYKLKCGFSEKAWSW